MKFVYLVQTEDILPQTFEPLLHRQGAHLIRLTFKNPVEGAIFLPNSTWTQGRNCLLHEAVNRHPAFDYIIFCDDDIVFERGDWDQFEHLLETWRPAIGMPCFPGDSIDHGFEAHTLYSFDAMFNAFHRDVVQDEILLPYIERYDDVTWWLSQFFLVHYAQALYPDKIAKFSSIQVDNPLHRPYPRITTEDFLAFEQIYQEQGWRDTAFGASRHRVFHDPASSVIRPFSKSERSLRIASDVRQKLNLDGPLLGDRASLHRS